MALDQKLGELHVDLLAREEKFEQQLRDAERKGEKSGKKSGKKFGDSFARASKRGLDRMQRLAGRAFRNIGRMATRSIKIGLVTAFGAATAAAFKFITTTAKFERLELRFTQLFGSVEKGKQEFKSLVELAASTPFALESLAEGVATMEAFHQGSSVLIESIGDLSVFMNTTVPEAAAAFGRAMSAGAGAADILRERGILNLVKLSSGIDDLTKLTLPQFRKALIDTLTDPNGRIAGGTRALANTLEGRWSTFKDKITEVFSIIGQRMRQGTVDKLDDWIDAIDKFISSGKIDDLASRVEAAFNTILKIIDKVGDFFNKWLEPQTVRETINELQQVRAEIQRMRSELEKGGKLNKEDVGILNDILGGDAKGNLKEVNEAMKQTSRGIKDLVTAVTSGETTLEGSIAELMSNRNRAKNPKAKTNPKRKKRATSADINLGEQATEKRAPIDELDRMRADAIAEDILGTFDRMDDEARAKYESALGFMEDKFAAFWSGMLRIEARSENRLVQGFINMANAFTAEVERMIVKWLAFQAIKAIGSKFGIPIPLPTGGAPAAKHGADVVTPGNFVGERVVVTAGPNERVQVTPSGGKSGSESKLLAQVITRLDALNMNVSAIDAGGDILATVTVKDRKLAEMVERSNKRDTRFR